MYTNLINRVYFTLKRDAFIYNIFFEKSTVNFMIGYVDLI